MATCGWCHSKDLRKTSEGLEEHTTPTVSGLIPCHGYETWLRLTFTGGVAERRENRSKRPLLVKAR